VTRLRHLASTNATTAVLMSIGYAVALSHRTAFQGIDRPLRAEFAMSASESADLPRVSSRGLDHDRQRLMQHECAVRLDLGSWRRRQRGGTCCLPAP